MDVTIRNVDGDAYRAIKAQAAAEGRTVGEVVSDAMRAYRQRPPRPTAKTFFDLWPRTSLGAGTEHLGDEVDDIVYGPGA